MNKDFKVGDIVRWTPHVRNIVTEKLGQIVAIIPAGQKPSRIEFGSLYNAGGNSVGEPRPHDSYVVRGMGVRKGKTKMMFYWPVVSKLAYVQSLSILEGEAFLKGDAGEERKEGEDMFDNEDESQGRPTLSSRTLPLDPTLTALFGEGPVTVTRARKWLEELEKRGHGPKSLVVATPSLADSMGLAPSGEIMGFQLGLAWNVDKVFAITPEPVGAVTNALESMASKLDALVEATNRLEQVSGLTPAPLPANDPISIYERYGSIQKFRVG